jgi:hypothetical protein
MLEQLEPRELLTASVPTPDHVVIVIEENHSFSEIIGSTAAPYINSLAQHGALFRRSFAIGHPSQPNYLELFSGSNQGVTDDDSLTSPLTTLNLGASLIQADFTFAGYSEGLPSTGSTVDTSGAYARKHNPWVNWQGASDNAIPASDNLRFADFPTDFSTLPTVAFVIPDVNNDMHDGTIEEGDAWLQTNLDAYAQWANTHNSLLIVTFDENDGSARNRIPTIFYGPMVAPGQYSEHITHYNVLRTVEDMFALPYAGASASAAPITDVWHPVLTAIPDQMIHSSQQSLPLELSATSFNGHPLTFSAVAQSLAYVLTQQTGELTYFSELDNMNGQGEKWLQAGDGQWYFILAGGDFYRWDGSDMATSPLLGNVGSSYYDDANRLVNPSAGQPRATLSVVDSTLTITLDPDWVSAMVITVTASDGQSSDTKSFNVTVTG